MILKQLRCVNGYPGTLFLVPRPKLRIVPIAVPNGPKVVTVAHYRTAIRERHPIAI